jgi:hypothetical protein
MPADYYTRWKGSTGATVQPAMHLKSSSFLFAGNSIAGKDLLMKKNRTVADRILRFVAAIAQLVLFSTNASALPVNTALLPLAGIFVLTAYRSPCLLYPL